MTSEAWGSWSVVSSVNDEDKITLSNTLHDQFLGSPVLWPKVARKCWSDVCIWVRRAKLGEQKLISCQPKKTLQSVRCWRQCSSASVGCIWQFYQQPCDFLEAAGLADWWKLGGSQKSQQGLNLCFWLPSSESNKTLLQITISALT